MRPRVIFFIAKVFVVSLSLLPLKSVVAQTGSQAPIEQFVGPAEMADVSLSPDGQKIAYLAPVKGRQNLFIRKIKLDPGEKPIVIGPDTAEIISVSWVGNEYLIAEVQDSQNLAFFNHANSITSTAITYRRQVSVSANTGNVKVLLDKNSTFSGAMAQFYPMLGTIDDTHIVVRTQSAAVEDLAVLNIDLATGRHAVIEKLYDDEVPYIVDSKGAVRVKYKRMRGGQEVSYRYQFPDGKTRELFQFMWSDLSKKVVILGLDASGEKIYVASRHEGDRLAVYLYDPASGRFMDRIVDSATADVAAAKVGRMMVVEAFDWTEDLPRRKWLDANVQALQDRLDAAVPDSREIILDISDDGNRALVASHSQSSPTTFRLYDKASRRFDLIGDTYPELAQENVSTHQPVSYKARDGLEIHGYLTVPKASSGKGLPLVVMPFDYPFDGFFDGRFDPAVQFLADRGIAVLQINQRGTTGRGAAFTAAGHGQWGRASVTDVADAIRWALASGIAAPSRVCVAGRAYGGYAALMLPVIEPGLVKCVIANSAISDPSSYRKLMFGTENDAAAIERFGEDRDNLAAVSPLKLADRVKVPVLLVHGESNGNVPFTYTQSMERALRNAGGRVELLAIKDMNFEPATADQWTQVLSVWERFLKENIAN